MKRFAVAVVLALLALTAIASTSGCRQPCEDPSQIWCPDQW